MHFETGREVCDHHTCNGCRPGCHFKCETLQDYSIMSSDEFNKIIWYSCGHVLIIRDGTVVQQYDYSK